VIVTHLVHFQKFVEPRSGAVTSARAEILTFLGAYAVFLAGLMLRGRSFPPLLRWLGQISYSVYLVHGVVLAAVPQVGGKVTTIAVWLAVTLAVSTLTYRLIERPFQEMGRRAAKRSAERALARTDAKLSPAV
jgi:peptidoglycan/LPS O-acetylase OafA/YrhL